MNNRKASLLMSFLKVNALQNASKCFIACNLMVFENIFKEFLSTTTIDGNGIALLQYGGPVGEHFFLYHGNAHAGHEYHSY